MYIRYSDPNVRNRALLQTGEIVEYDECCRVGEEPTRPPNVMLKSLGRGKIFEVQGVRQYPTGKDFEFWERV